ncbi:hypothetical protein CFI10_00415 [Marinobacterium iners]|uniref:hypothetical protein n=1 Tax=Marinobacterium iners TaxID=48076 RepID=UPI001A8E0AD0|nr:hypothetical protein [Marinobacterium iners]QSR33476.1 hypothetical protein CFI10_00415 [Marinobacterium iners]
MNNKDSLNNWREKVEGWVDVRPDDKVYRIAREAYTDRDVFDLEMELIFENTWIFACHESQIANNNDFFTMQAVVRFAWALSVFMLNGLFLKRLCNA